MNMTSLKDIYIQQLQDLHSADDQCIEAVAAMAETADDAELESALKSGVDGIREGRQVLSELVRLHGSAESTTTCQAMDGLVAEATARIQNTKYENAAVRDAVIISQYQRMIHYAIAGYGCLIAFARKLDLHKDADKLRRCLDRTTDGDRHMTEIAITTVNKAAA